MFCLGPSSVHCTGLAHYTACGKARAAGCRPPKMLADAKRSMINCSTSICSLSCMSGGPHGRLWREQLTCDKQGSAGLDLFRYCGNTQTRCRIIPLMMNRAFKPFAMSSVQAEVPGSADALELCTAGPIEIAFFTTEKEEKSNLWPIA